MPDIILRAATLADLPALEALLTTTELPRDGVAANVAGFWIAEEESALIGSIGLERYADAALVRSVAVAPHRQRQRLGHRLVERLIGEASAEGIDTLFLLTTTAERFFTGFGFEVIPRDAAPNLVRSSVQFTSSCSESATVMRLSLRDDG